MNKDNLTYDAQFEDSIVENEAELIENEFETKRNMLENNLILDPDYQRNNVWDASKQISFIESLFMGIMIPPIYVVEIPGDSLLDSKKYEVVDGKQRLSTIKDFLNNNLKLNKRYLEYYSDLFDGKFFNNLSEVYGEHVSQLLSSILDIYVITSNSPTETKYDIFARLNKGASPLKVNEIRKAIFHSGVTQIVDNFINEKSGKKDSQNKEYINPQYLELFSKNDIRHFNDYGRFYRSIAFYYSTNISTYTVEKYNSRPKQMIDNILQSFQNKERPYEEDVIRDILIKTIELIKLLKENSYKEYLIDACIPFSLLDWDKLKSNINNIANSESINNTFKKSLTTTSNVNERVKIISHILKEAR